MNQTKQIERRKYAGQLPPRRILYKKTSLQGGNKKKGRGKKDEKFKKGQGRGT